MKHHSFRSGSRCLGAIALFACCTVARAESAATLKLLPEKTTLAGAHASQQLLLERVAKEQFTGDATSKAKFTSSNTDVATVDDAGIVHPVGDGAVSITASIDGQTAITAVSVTGMKREAPRSFRNDVEPLLAKMGCSMGACHGA